MRFIENCVDRISPFATLRASRLGILMIARNKISDSCHNQQTTRAVLFTTMDDLLGISQCREYSSLSDHLPGFLFLPWQLLPPPPPKVDRKWRSAFSAGGCAFSADVGACWSERLSVDKSKQAASKRNERRVKQENMGLACFKSHDCQGYVCPPTERLCMVILIMRFVWLVRVQCLMLSGSSRRPSGVGYTPRSHTLGFHVSFWPH